MAKKVVSDERVQVLRMDGDREPGRGIYHVWAGDGRTSCRLAGDTGQD